MRPNLNKFITNHESNKEDTKNSNPSGNGADNSAPNLFIDNHKKEGKLSVMDALKSSRIQGVKDTGETKFMDIEEYRKYSDREDKGVSPFAFGANHNLSRALNQSNWEQTGHAVAKFIPNTILEFTSMLGNTLDAEDYIQTDQEVGNWLSTWAQEQKQNINEALPVHRENPGQAMDVGDYAWWVENGSSLAESAVAFVGLGYLTGGAALGTLTKGGKALKWLQTLGQSTALGDRAKKAIQGGAGIANTLMLNQAEGVGIAVQVFDESYKKAVEKLKAENPELTDEEIDLQAKDIASKNASKALNFNRANMLLNATSALSFLKVPALTRQIRSNPAIRKTLQNSVLEGVQESGEELINLASENYGMDGEGAKFEDAFRDTFTAEGAEAALLGFVGGAGQTGLTSIGNELKLKKNPDGSRYSRNDVLRERALEQEEAKQRWEGLSQEEKLTSTSDLFMTAKQLTELKNEIDKVDIQIEQARKNGNTEEVGKLQLKAQELAKNTFNSKAFHAFSTGTTKQLEEFYAGIAGLTEEEAEQRGLDPATYKEKVTNALTNLKTLEEEFNKANNYVDSLSIYSNRARLNDLRSQKEPLETGKEEAYSKLREDMDDLNLDLYNIQEEDGSLNLNKLSEEKRKLVKDLDSYATVETYNELLKLNKQRRETLAKEYANLTSKDYQDNFKNDLKKRKQTKKTDSSKDTVKKKKEETDTTTNKKKEEFKKTTTPPTSPSPSSDTGQTTTKTTPPVDEEDGDIFEAEGNDEFTTGLNTFVNRKDLKPETKLHTLQGQLKNLNPNDKDGLDALTSAIDFIKNKSRVATGSPKDIGSIVERELSNFEISDGKSKTLIKGLLEILRKNGYPVKSMGYENGKLLIDNEQGLEMPVDFKADILGTRAVVNFDTVDFTESLNLHFGKVKDTQKDNIDAQINDLATFLEDNSPAQEDLSPASENVVRQKINKVINLMESLGQRGVNTSNFAEVATYLQDVMGKERFVPLFNDIKDIYNLSKINPKRIEATYEDIFYSSTDKQKVVDNDEVVKNASLPEGFYNYDNNEINELNKESIVERLKEQGYTVYKGDTIEQTGFKTEIAYNKLAHLDKKYSTDIISGGTKFNVLSFIHDKRDISNFIDGNTDEALLDFDQINVGTKVTFVPLNKVIYDDGTIVYADGTIEKDGETRKEDPRNIAPIGVKVDGVLLNKVFLHTTEWVNMENIAYPDDVKNQKNKLFEIRKKVLRAGAKGITTTVTNRTDGFLLRNADGVQDTVSNRLPNIEIGIVKDNAVYTGENTTTSVGNKDLSFNGVSVGIIPVNKDKKLAIGLNRLQLAEKREYIDSMLHAVRLYLKNDVNDERAIQLFDASNIDITTEEGLREYLSKFIYLPNDLDFEFDKFANYLENQNESVSLVRVVGKNIEFGRGAGVNKGARFLNRTLLANMQVQEREQLIEAALSALDNTLSNNMTVNISKNKMGKKFVLPIITDTEVNTTEYKYNDFVKDHLKTDLYSHTLSNGKEIYTVQSNVEFDESFAFRKDNKVSEEATDEALGTPKVQASDDSVEVSHKGKSIKINFDDDFSPSTIPTVTPFIPKTFEYYGQSVTINSADDVIFKANKLDNGDTIYNGEVKTEEGLVNLGAIGVKEENGRKITTMSSLSPGIPRGKGLGFDLYKTLILHLSNDNIEIYSDHRQSDAAIGVWEKLVKEGLATRVPIQEGEEKHRYKSVVEDLSPKQFTDKQLQEFEDTTPSSLLVPGVPIKTQTALIDYLSAEIIKERTKEPVNDLQGLLKVALEAYNNKLSEGLPAEQRDRIKKGADILEAVLSNYNKLTSLVEQNLFTYNNLKYTGASFSVIENAIEVDSETDEDTIKELEEVERNRWSSESVFTEDAKSTASTEVKNALAYVQDVEGFNYTEDGVRIPVNRTTVFGLDSYILFDEIVNEISGILAFNNYDDVDKITQPSLESMLDTLEDWVDAKPYLHNVIEKIKAMPATTQNQFVGVMSKHYTHHALVFKNASGNYYVNNSDSNNIAAVVQNSWLQNLINSDLVLPSDTTYVLDGDKIDYINEKVPALVSLLKAQNKDQAIKVATSILNDIGIDLSEDTVTSLYDNPVNYGKGVQSLLHLFTGSDGAIKLYLDRLNELKGADIQENHPFKNNSSLSGFAKEMAKRNPVYFSNSFKDVRGRTYYSYSANKFFIDRFRRLKTDRKLLKDLEAQPFSSNSYWVDMMLSNPDNFYRYFKYYTFDGRKESKTRGKKLTQMSPAEHEESKVALFFSQNKKGSSDNYIVNVFYPTTSDKGLQPTLSVLGHKISKNLNPRTKQLTTNGLNWLYDVLVQPEINRMLAYQANPSKYNTKGYSDGATTFNMFPQLNSIKSAFIEENGIRILNPAINTDENIKNELKKVLKNHIQELVNDKINTWNSYGFIEEIEEEHWDEQGRPYTTVNRELSLIRNKKYNRKDGKEIDPNADATKAAYNYVVNYLVANTNIMQTMITDPANYFKSKQYKAVINRLIEEGEFETAEGLTREDVLGYYTEQDFIAEHEDLFDNMGKRLAGDIAPGSDPAFEKDSTFTVAHINDEESASVINDYYKKLVGNGYDVVNSTDAQEFTTLKEHLTVMKAEGKIDNATMQSILAKESKGENLSVRELGVLFQPMKPVYVNNIFKDGTEHRVYIKSSSFPLVKQFTKDLEIDKLRRAMLRDNIDRVAFDSAIKVGGTTKPTTIYDSSSKGKVLDKIDLKSASLTLPREGFKIQQEVPYKEKDNINDGSQQRKLLTSAVRQVKGFKIPNSDKPYTGEEVQQEIDKTYNKIYKLKYDALLEEIEYNLEDNTVNLSKIQKILQEEGLKRNYPLYDLEGFKLDNTGEDFIVPLWLNSSSTKVESMLNSIIDNRVRKLKPKGRSYVLGTSTGFRPIILEGEEASKEIKNTSGIVLDKEWAQRGDGQLKNMRVENGELKPAEVMIKPRFKNHKGKLVDIRKYVDADGFIDTSKLDASLLERFAYRIPTQGLNSMSYVKVVGFLPDTSGDLFLAPADWTIQMGSDFDVDKIYTNSYNTLYNKETGALSRYEGEDELKKLENHLLDLHFSILGNPDEKVQKEILKPLDFGKLGDMAEEIYPLVEDRKPGRGMSEEYQKFKYLNARAGAIGIGVFSNDSTFNALAQGKYLRLVKPTINGAYTYKFSLGNKDSNTISEPLTNTKKRTKADVIAAYQSLAVDNEKEQGMHKLNINSYTFDAIRTLTMSGFEEDIISYFLNQPIIRDYVRLKTLADDNSTVYTTTDLDNDLNEKYEMPDENENQYLSLEVLKGGIRGTRNNYQQTVLKLFLELSEYGKQIQAVQSAINTDSAGLGKDLFYAFEKESQVLNLPFNAVVSNAEQLIGNYKIFPEKTMDGDPIDFSKEDIDKAIAEGYIPVTPLYKGNKLASNITLIEPTTINGFTSVYALMFNNRLWERFFPYNNSRLNLAFATIKSLTNQTQARLAQNAELNQDLFKDAKSYIIANQLNSYSEGDLVSERQRLLVDTKENISLGNILQTVVKNGYSNSFLNRLEINANKAILPTLIQYQASATENINERALYAGFSNMFLDDTTNLGEFNGIQYTPRKLAQDLVTAQLISGGVQQANQYVRYIPMNYLHSIGFYEDIKNLDFYNNKDFNDRIYSNQYIQHNPDKVVLRNLEGFKEAGLTISEDKETIKYKPTDKSSKTLPGIFSLRNNNRVKGYDLYFKSETISGQWVRVTTLGYSDMLEYNPFDENAKSIVPDNNASDVPTPPDLPTNEDEFNEFNKLTEDKNLEGEEVLNKKGETVADQYNLKTNDTFVNTMTVVLDKIIENDYNSFNTLMAREVAKNLNVIEDFNFILTNAIGAEASHSLKDRTIKVNLNNISNDRHFEEVILEELIHALTKPAIVANTTGAVNRLNGLRKQAIQALSKSMSIELQIETVKEKLKNGTPLMEFEYNLVYPLINDTEFIGRLFKSEQLQKLLNETPSNEEGKSVLDKIWDTIVELLNSVGLDIKKGSALEYAVVDIISLINQEAPSSDVQGEIRELNPVYRTKEWIEERFKLKKENGTNRTYLDAQDKADFINANYKGIQAVVVNNTVVLEYKYGDLLGEDFSPSQKKSDNVPLFKSYQDRIRTLEKNIDKAKAKDNFQKVEQLTSTLDALNERYIEAVKIGSKERLAQIAVKGKQDMAEVAEFFKSEMTVEDTLYIRKILHFWETSVDTLFDESERESEKLVNLFGEVETSARYYSDKLVKIESDYMEDFMKRYGKATTIENIFTHFRDINFLQENTMDISRIDNDLLNSVFLAVKEANINAVDDVNELIGDLGALEDKVIKTLKAKGYKDENLYDLFRQRTADGKLTGHIVDRYNRDFSKTLRTLVRQVESNRDFNSFFNYMNWARNNTKVVKLGYLFPTGKFSKEEQKKVDKYKEELKQELGENHYNEFIEEQAKAVEKYNRYKDDFVSRLMEDHNLNSLQEVLNHSKAGTAYKFWKKANSPYEYYRQLNNTTDQSLKKHKNFGSVQYVVQLPSKDESYDANFKAIENNATLYEFYQYYSKVDKQLKSFMPTNDRVKLAFSGIPHIEKSIFSAYNDKGMKAGLAPIWSEIKKSIREEPESNIVSRDIDPVTGIEDKSFRTNLGRNNGNLINNYILNQSIDYKAETGNDAPPALIEKWKEEIIDELAQQKSYNLPKVLRVYAMTVLAYKHKSKIEDSIKLAQNILNTQQEIKRNNRGQIITDESGLRPQYKPLADSFTRTKNQFSYYIDSLYGKTNKTEGLDNKKSFTSEEKEQVQDLEDRLDNLEEAYKSGKFNATEYISAKKQLEDQIDEVGGYAAWSKRGDKLLKYIQLKGMGWNVMSAIANVGFGTISNVIEGAGGQLYTSKQLNKGYRMTMASIGRNATFNRWNPGEAKKIRNLMDRWDVLKDASHELYENPFTVQLSKQHKWLSPYNLTQRTEYINQAPLMIALMLNTPVKTKNGDTINLWEATTEDGTLKDGIEVDKATINKVRIRLDQVIKRNHGNYDPNSPLALKKTFIGRALGQFRTWMFEGVAARFESEKYDPALDITVKGRYRSLVDYFATDVSPNKIVEVLKALAKFQTFGALFKDADFEQFGDPKDFNETDVANMRRVIAEAVIYIDVYIAYALLAMVAGNLDDEDDSVAKFAINSMINQGLRLRTDLTFYVSPAQFKALLRDPLPAASIIKDTGEWGESIYRVLEGEDEIGSGVYSGHSRFLRESAQMMPLGTQGYRIFNYGVQVFDK